MEFGDYVEIFRKRKISFFLAFSLIVGIGITIAFTLPAIYSSKATILIEGQEIPQELVATTVTGFVQQRIAGIKQRLVAYQSLVDIAEKFDLYPKLRASKDISKMVSIIRDNIEVAMVDIKSNDGKKGRAAVTTIALTVGYMSDKPDVAQKVAKELSERYLEENKLSRSEQAAKVSEFLELETEKLRQKIIELENSLAVFKQEQSDQLPELLQVNMRLFEKTEGQLEASNDRMLKIEDQIASLESQLSLTDPNKAVLGGDGKVVQTPSERLSSLILLYLNDSVRYAPTHPDMVRLRREIQALGSQSTDAGKVSDLVSQLTLQRSKLLDAKQKYSDEHLEVVQLQKSVISLETQLRSAKVTGSKETDFSNIAADNPRYISLKTQLDSARSNLKEEKAKASKYQEKLKEYEKRLFQTPIVERDYKTLTRDYGNAKAKYSELKNKQLEARLAEQLEAEGKGERFVLESPAYFPTSPDSPNRLGIALLAALLAFAGGLGIVALLEYRDDSINGSRGVVEVFGALPIIVVPYIENTADVTRKKRKKVTWIAVGLVSLASGLGAYYILLV